MEGGMTMEMSKNDILLHYEELGDIDLKISISLQLVAEYFQAFTGSSMSYAKKMAMELRDPTKGWAEVMDQDERFYVWCKNRYFGKATKRRSQNRECVVYWLNAGKLHELHTPTKDAATRVFNRVSVNHESAAVYLKSADGKRVSLNPWLRKNAEPIIVLVDKMRLSRLEDDEVSLCRRNRQVKCCEQCLRYEDCQTWRKK